MYRCSVHCALGELSEMLATIEPHGRLYSTLCEFNTEELLPDEEDASAIVGIVGSAGGFQFEMRLNRAPLPEDANGRLAGAPVGVSGRVCSRSPLRLTC